MFNCLKAYLKSESGATAIEYGMIAGLLSLLVIAGLLIAGPEIQDVFVRIGDFLAAASGGGE